MITQKYSRVADNIIVLIMHVHMLLVNIDIMNK